MHNLTELKVRLQHEKFDGQTAFELLGELKELGETAAPLIPLLVPRLVDGSIACDSSSAVHIYLSTGNPELLAFIRSSDFWPRVGIHDYCQLFSAGLAELEPDLLRYLWENFAKPDEPMRRYVVESLGDAGSTAALDLLAVVDSRLSGEIAERSVSAQSQEDEPGIERYFEGAKLASQQGFVQLVREAAESIKSRNG